MTGVYLHRYGGYFMGGLLSLLAQWAFPVSWPFSIMRGLLIGGAVGYLVGVCEPELKKRAR